MDGATSGENNSFKFKISFLIFSTSFSSIFGGLLAREMRWELDGTEIWTESGGSVICESIRAFLVFNTPTNSLG